MIGEREISALRANEDRVAWSSLVDASLNRASNCSLRPLTAIIDRRVDEIDAFLDCRGDGVLIRRVVRVRALAQIRPDADRRQRVARESAAVEIGCITLCESRRV